MKRHVKNKLQLLIIALFWFPQSAAATASRLAKPACCQQDIDKKTQFLRFPFNSKNMEGLPEAGARKTVKGVNAFAPRIQSCAKHSV